MGVEVIPYNAAHMHGAHMRYVLYPPFTPFIHLWCLFLCPPSPGPAAACRVMVECQELWLGGLRSAGPGSGHFARLGCVRVVLGDGLAGTVRVSRCDWWVTAHVCVLA